MDRAQFFAKHGAALPRKPAENPDQLRPLTREDGVVSVEAPPFPSSVAGDPGFAPGKHLWVLVPHDLPVILETAPDVRPPPLQSGVAKHTNLTGGGPACSGGELWVDAVSAALLYVNGGSGRYGPKTPAELDDAVQVFRGLGFQVESAGWDDGNDIPARTFRKP
jgi:hypothetical protein